MDSKLEVGKVVNTFGVKGFLKIVPYTDNIERFHNLKTVFIKEEELEILEVKFHKQFVLLKLKGIETIEQAELYKNNYVLINRKDAVKLPKDSYFIIDMIGIAVYTEQEEYLGNLEDIFATGSNDVYVVKDELGKQLLLPAISSVIKKIDLPNKRMIVNLIEGLK